MPSLSKAIDIVLQRSVIDLFASHGVTVAPVSVTEVGQRKPHCYEFVTVVHFASAQFWGSLAFSAPATTLTGMRQGALGSVRDWSRELTNQLLGRVKNKLIRYQMNLDVDVPSVFDCRILEAKASTTSPFLTDPGTAFLEKLRKKVDPKAKVARRGTLYVFRTVGSEVFVTLHAACCDDALVQVSTAPGVEEGDVLLFD